MRAHLLLWAVICIGLFASCTSEDASTSSSSYELGEACVPTAITSGETALCASCECGSCTRETTTCFDLSDSKKAALCQKLVACEHAKGCSGDACYCGTGLEAAGCLINPAGPCRAEVEAASGVRGLIAVRRVRDSKDAKNPLVRAEALVTCTQAQCKVACAAPSSTCGFEDLACQDRICHLDADREAQRKASAETAAQPSIEEIRVAGVSVWRLGSQQNPALRAGEQVTLLGRGFGAGPDIDFAKLMIGNSRVLETDLKMYEQKLDILKQVNYEVPTIHSTWSKDILSWSDSEIVFRVPVHASRGPIVVQVQKRLAANHSLLRPGSPHLVVDAQTSRIRDQSFSHNCDVVSGLGDPLASAPVPVSVTNPNFDALVKRGREIFWSYDYNIGTAHAVRNLDWTKVLGGRATDPTTGTPADPFKLFGAYTTQRGEVPDEAIDEVRFDPYPQPSPIPGFLTIIPQKMAGKTKNSGFAGYRYAESVHPFKGYGEWIGFNCASCHGYRVSYERAPNQPVTRVIPGLPNPLWSMKWAVLDRFTGIKDSEEGPRWASGKQPIDKTALIYAMPQGTGEHNIVRLVGEGSHTDNDYQFSPITIPNVTNYMPIRRSLSHTESYVGFEGSYIHSEEPDGAMGSMRADALQALTAYMTTLDQYDDELRRVGMHRHLKARGELQTQVGNVSEGAFVQAGFGAYPELQKHLERGQQIFAQRCGSCHRDALGANTNERMLRLDEVGRFFAPTIYQKEMQAIRVTFLRDLYWVQHRGLLSDGHVRNLRDLVDPARCTPGTTLYDAYYTLHEPRDPGSAGPDFPAAYPETGRRGDVFRVRKAPSSKADDAGAQSNRFIERHRYFVSVPWDAEHYYWDYQKMRAEYGPAELGTSGPVGMPAAPHPWCAGAADEVEDLVQHLLTL